MPRNRRILLVEDDVRLGAQVVETLREAGYEPTWLQNGDEALLVEPGGYDLAILDLMLPGAYGLDVLKRLRGASDLPVLVLSARTDTQDKVRALQLGADDFVTKPFWPEELLARVGTRLRRPLLERAGRLQLGALDLDLDGRAAALGGRPLDLTRVEFDVLAVLAQRAGAAVPRSELVRLCLDPEREGNERTLDVHVSRLRKKLAELGNRVATVWGVGYRFESEAAR